MLKAYQIIDLPLNIFKMKSRDGLFNNIKNTQLITENGCELIPRIIPDWDIVFFLSK